MMEQNDPSGIRLVAMDMDGTLLNDRKELPKDFIPWVRRHPEVLKVIASGRQYYQLLRDLAPLGDELIYIAENGGIVFENGEQIYCNAMAEEDQRLALSAVRHAQEQLPELTLSPILCGAGSAWLRKDASEEAKRNAALYYARLGEAEDLFSLVGTDSILKIAVFVSNRRAKEAYAAFGPISERLNAVVSGDSWIDIANDDEDKGLAVEAICRRHGLRREQCMAFGDYMNDSGLLQSCGESYCMENGLEELKRLARYVAPSNNEEGVMQVLKARIGE